ncbi:recombination protein NinG [Pseudomonadales bacterium]|nr:recombination protein NinG [Pseudomonadales bacterium]
MAKQSIKTIRNRCWKLLSRLVRGDAYCKCITCGKVAPAKEMHAGHFIHGKTKKTYLDRRNVHPQCVSCNMYKSGNLGEYALYMIDHYGREVIDELKELSNEMWTSISELLEIEKALKEELE